jgi:hypothetical protein
MKLKMNGRGRAVMQIAVLLFLCQPVISLAGDITFSSSGTITDGNVYDNVYVQNDGTVVDMSGGQIASLWLSDASRFNMTGGYIMPYSINAAGTSYFDMSGGIVDSDEIILYGSGGSFSGGDVSVSVRLKTGVLSTIEFEAGTLNFGAFDIQGSMNIRGGDLTVDNIGLHLDSLINIYSEDYNYNAGSKVLTAYLIDGGYLSMSGLDQSEYDSINFVPEPTSFLLLFLSGLFLRTRR